MCNVFVSCEFYLFISYVNKLKETSESLSEKLKAKLNSKPGTRG